MDRLIQRRFMCPSPSCKDYELTGRMMIPTMMGVLKPGTCEYVRLHGK